MTIRATCKCGKQVQTRDENAGKRMKCPGCGEVVTMPAAAAAATKPTPAATKPALAPGKPSPAEDKPATVSFSCDCGKQLHAKAEQGGKRVKCPACGTVLTVPHPDSLPTEEFDAAPEPEVRTTRSPTPPMKPPVVEDDEDEESPEDEAPARRGKKASAVEDEDEERDEEDQDQDQDEERPARKRRKSKAPLIVGL